MNILTFDIEEWWVYNKYAHYGQIEESLPRLDRYLNGILDLLDHRDFKATFFCLGDVAQNYPEIIKRIASRGHHIGCHSNNHRFLEDLTPDEFATDTKMALENIENVIGKKVNTYRAPAFSITENTKWALEILAEHGIEYDCSIFPAKHRYGGYPSIKMNKPAIIQYKNIKLKEFPVSLSRFLFKQMAFSGGGYFRLFPYSVIHKSFKNRDYIMGYFHIRDFDAELLNQDSISEAKMSRISYFKNFYGISGAYKKFKKLIQDFEFLNIAQAADLIDWKNVSVVKL